jgi:hypothetical protein
MSIQSFRKQLIKEGVIEKTSLNEVAIGELLSLISLPLVYYAVKYLAIEFTKLAGKAMGKTFYPSDNAVTAANELWKDSGFIKDFATIIKNEGDFNEFIKKTQTASYNGYEDYDRINWKGFQSYRNTASNVVEKILKTASFKKIANKFKLDKDEIQFIGNDLFYVITSEKFRKKALEIRNSVFSDMAKNEWGNKPSKKH